MDDPLRMIAAFVAAAADRLLNMLAGGRRRPSEPSPPSRQPVVFAVMRMDCGDRARRRSARSTDTLIAQLSKCARCRSKDS